MRSGMCSTRLLAMIARLGQKFCLSYEAFKTEVVSCKCLGFGTQFSGSIYRCPCYEVSSSGLRPFSTVSHNAFGGKTKTATGEHFQEESVLALLKTLNNTDLASMRSLSDHVEVCWRNCLLTTAVHWWSLPPVRIIRFHWRLKCNAISEQNKIPWRKYLDAVIYLLLIVHTNTKAAIITIPDKLHYLVFKFKLWGQNYIVVLSAMAEMFNPIWGGGLET